MKKSMPPIAILLPIQNQTFCQVCLTNVPILVCLPCHHAFCYNCKGITECHICNDDPTTIFAAVHKWPRPLEHL